MRFVNLIVLALLLVLASTVKLSSQPNSDHSQPDINSAQSTYPNDSRVTQEDRMTTLAEKYYEQSEKLAEKTITLSETLMNVVNVFLIIFFAFNALNVFQTGQIRKKNDQFLKTIQEEMDHKKSMVDCQLQELEDQEKLMYEKLTEVQKLASSFDRQFTKAVEMEERLDSLNAYMKKQSNDARGRLTTITNNFSYKGELSDDKKEAFAEYYRLSELAQKLGEPLEKDDYLIRSVYCLINREESKFMINFQNWILKDASDNPFYVIGNTYRKLDNPEKALEFYKSALKINPYNSKAWHFQTGIMIKLRSQTQALAEADAALKLDPINANCWYVKTLIFRSQDKFDEALEACNKAIELDKQVDTISIDEEVLIVKANILVKLGRLEEALICAENATESLPDNSQANDTESLPDKSNAFITKSRILRALGMYNEALQSANEAIKIAPRKRDPWFWAARAQFMLKDYDQAIELYLKCLELDKDCITAFYNIACSYALKGNRKLAIEYLVKSIAGSTKYKEMARKDEDFKNLWEDQEFISTTT